MPPQLLLVDGFETGVYGTNGGVYSSVSANATPDSTVKRTGTYSLKCACTASTAYVGYTWARSSANGRFYFRYHTFPNSLSRLVNLLNSGNSGIIAYDPADGKLWSYHSSNPGYACSTVLQADTWYRLDFNIGFASSNCYINFQVDGVAATESVASNSATAGTFLYIGAYSLSVTTELNIDDFVMVSSNTDYPIGAGAVEVLLPSSDGTHNGGTNTIENNAGTDIVTPGFTTAYDLVNDVPMSSTADYIQQAAGGAGNGNYAEINFADTSNTSIVGAMAYLSYTSSATQSNNGSAKIMDEDSSLWNIYSGDMSESSVFYKSLYINNPTNGWDQAAVNALKARIGYSTDASPLPRWHAIQIQVAYATTDAPTLVVADSSCTSQTDALGRLVKNSNVVTNDSSCISFVETFKTTKNTSVVVLDSFSTSQSDNVILVRVRNLTVQDSSCISQADSFAITRLEGPKNLVVQDLFSTSQTDTFKVTKNSNVVVQDSFSTSQTDTFKLTKNSSIVVLDSYSTSQSDNVTIVRVRNLAVQDSYSISQVDIATVVKIILLTVADSYSTSQVDAVSTTKQSTLVVADSFSTDQSDNITLTITQLSRVKVTWITLKIPGVGVPTANANDSYSISQADNVTLTQVHNLQVQDSSCVSQTDNVVLVRVRNLTVQDAFVTSQTDNVKTTKQTALVVLDSFSLSQADNVSVIVTKYLAVQDSFSTSQVDSPYITKRSTLVVTDSYSTSQTDLALITKRSSLVLSDTFVTTQSDNITLARIVALIVADSFSTSQADLVLITKQSTLSLLDSYVTTQVDTAVINSFKTLVIQDSFSSSQTDSIVLTKQSALIVVDLFSTTQTDNIKLVKNSNLVLADSFSTSQTDNVVIVKTSILSILDSYSVSTLDTFALTKNSLINVADSYSVTFVEHALITKQSSLVLTDLYSTSYSDALTLVKTSSLSIEDSYSITFADAIYLVQNGILKLHPISDQYQNGWTDQNDSSSSLYEAINESPYNDADYIKTSFDPTNLITTLKLEAGTDPQSSESHIVRYRYCKDPVDADVVNLTVQLRQSYVQETGRNQDWGTLIAEWVHTDIPDTYQIAEQTLTEAQANSITNYSDLSIRLIASI